MINQLRAPGPKLLCRLRFVDRQDVHYPANIRAREMDQ